MSVTPSTALPETVGAPMLTGGPPASDDVAESGSRKSKAWAAAGASSATIVASRQNMAPVGRRTPLATAAAGSPRSRLDAWPTVGRAQRQAIRRGSGTPTAQDRDVRVLFG